MASGKSSLTDGDLAIRDLLDRALERPAEAVRSLPINLALACRMLADEGHARTLAGQVTARAEQPGTYWTTQWGRAFPEATADNLVRFDDDMQVVEGEARPNPAVRFHLWIYRSRPDVSCIIHTHAPYAAALAQTGEPLAVAHMDTTMFHNDCAFLGEWPGVPVGDEEGRIIDEALGGKRSILLANHGLLTTGRTLDEALYLAVLFEQAAQMHLLSRAIGPIKPITAELAADAHAFMTKPGLIAMTVESWFRQTLKRHPDVV